MAEKYSYPKAAPAAAARHAAVKRVLSEHEADYQRYHAEERMKRGLHPEVQVSLSKFDYLRQENERLRARLAELGDDMLLAALDEIKPEDLDA